MKHRTIYDGEVAAIILVLFLVAEFIIRMWP